MAALVRRFAAGAGLTALALSLLLAAGTGEARLALFGGLLALALLGWAVAFLRCVARQVAGFTDELCRTLDGMLDRSARPAPAAPAETLSARLHHRLERLYHTMEANRQAVEREKASLETLLARPVPWAQQRQFLQAAQGQLDKLDFLLQALVKTSRLETGLITLEKRDRPVADTLAAALNTVLAPLEAKGLRLTVDCPEGLTLPHDPKWTAEALSNLLDNAVKYTPPGGQVAVTVTPWDALVKIDVADTGRGIPEGEQGAIFQRFYREAAVHDVEGVGLGLFLTREIVTRQGGYVKVSSAPGQGATFSLFLPRG